MAFLVNPTPPCILFEDEDLLVANKPAGMNTHAPGTFAGDGLYDWLRHREPRWESLALVHRLDKETSGLIVFGKSTRANQSLTHQFTAHLVQKSYLFLTDGPPLAKEQRVRTALVRSGNRYRARPLHAGADVAETEFSPAEAQAGYTAIEARPLTGKTHQIRVHAAELGRPIAGDSVYGGATAPRLFLHAQRLVFRHPKDDRLLTFDCPPEFDRDLAIARRAGLFSSSETNAHRLIHGAADDHPGWYVDRLNDALLSQSAKPLTEEQRTRLKHWLQQSGGRAVYHKTLLPNPARPAPAHVTPQLVFGNAGSPLMVIRENGLRFQLDLAAGYSVGLFLDQRENRRRLLLRHIAARFPYPLVAGAPHRVLNAFAYTGGFSVCAAAAGAITTSIDLSRRYLDWARTNFRLNRLNPDEHSFLIGDVFDWLRRLHRKQRQFEVVLLDPPTFSRSKSHGVFRAEKDYGLLVSAALPLLSPNGLLFASANTARLEPEQFLNQLTAAIKASGRRLLRSHYVAQPLDYPITREEPAHLKSIWLEIE